MFYFVVREHFKELHTLGEQIGLSESSPYFQFITSQHENMFIYYLVFSAIALVIGFVAGLYITHKIAGPMHRLEKHFESLEGKEYEQFSFRDGDYFSSIPEKVNGYFDSK